MCDMQIIYCLFLKGHLKKQVWADVHDLEIRCYTPISTAQPLSHHINFKSYYRPQKKCHAFMHTELSILNISRDTRMAVRNHNALPMYQVNSDLYYEQVT